MTRRLQDSKYFLCYLIAVTVFLSAWHTKVIHHFSVRAFVVFAVFGVLSLIYGRVFIKFTSFSFKAIHGLSIQFLCGYLLLNTLLFLLVLSTPFGMVTNVFILAGAGLLLLFFFPGVTNDIRKPGNYLPDFLCLFLSGIAITLWCTDSLRPVVTEGPATIYQTFTDSFYHSRQISSFAQSHGLKTISDIRMAGLRPRIYHYAPYMTSAALMSCTNSSAYATFVSFHVPFGLLLTAFAAFSLAGSVWGVWPGLAGMFAVTFLPDAYQQGFGNKLFSYYFVQQAGSSVLYGIVCVAIAWIFILDGCRAGRFASILCGYAVLIITLTYKAHFFVANAFLLMIYPCIFFPGLKRRWRVISGGLLTSLFVFVVSVSQRFADVPTLRLDGSAIRPYAKFLLYFFDPGFFRSLFDWVLVVHQHSNVIFGLCLAGIVLICTFGLWSIAYVFVSFSVRAKIGAAAFFFPLFVTVNYIVMSVGLAEDARGISYPEELLYQPFVWAYFVLAAWTAAGLYAFLFSNKPPASRSARILTGMFAALSFSVPIAYGHNIQTLPTSKIYSSYKAINSVPTALTKACLYIRKQGRPEDLIQDSENDPRFVVTGLAERQAFALDCKLYSWNRNPTELGNRLEELAAFKKMGNEADLAEFIGRNKISWYILRPESETAWPISFRERSVFESGGYRVYRFNP